MHFRIYWDYNMAIQIERIVDNTKEKKFDKLKNGKISLQELKNAICKNT